MDFEKTIGCFVETTSWIGLTTKSTNSNNFKSFSKSIKCQITDWNEKTTGCFCTSLENTLFQKGFDLNQIWILINSRLQIQLPRTNIHTSYTKSSTILQGFGDIKALVQHILLC